MPLHYKIEGETRERENDTDTKRHGKGNGTGDGVLRRLRQTPETMDSMEQKPV